MASVNYKKCKAGTGAAGALMRHCDKTERLKHEHSNIHIDKSCTGQNIQSGNYMHDIVLLKDRIAYLDEHGNKNKRKDRVECFDLETAVPDGISAEDFCKLMQDEVAALYGRNNIIAWYLHRDEIHEYVDRGEIKTSKAHIHMFVVPEKDGQLQGKWFSSRSNMQQLNKSIDDRCRELGVKYMTGERPKHKTVEELKMNSLKEIYSSIDMAANDLQVYLGNLEVCKQAHKEAEKKLIEARESLFTLKQENITLEAKKVDLRANLSVLEKKMDDLDRAFHAARESVEDLKPKKRLFRDPVIEVSPEIWESITSRAAINSELGTLELRENAMELKRLADEYATLTKERADQYLETAKGQGQALLEDARQQSVTITQHVATIQIEQIRKDFPEVDRCFARNGVYQGKDWQDRQQQGASIHDKQR